MPVMSHSVEIKSPVSRVFEVVVNPDNWTRYVTSLVDISDLSPDAPAEGSTFRWEYKMMGLRFAGPGSVTENVKDKSFGLSIEGKHPVKESYEFVPKGDTATELKIDVEYEIPGALLGAIASKVVLEKMNKQEAKSVLEKIKTLCEEG